MKNELVLDPEVLEEFQRQALKRGEIPGSLLTWLMREQLADWADEEEEERQRAEQPCDYTDEEIVEIVRQYRHEKEAQQLVANQALDESMPASVDFLEHLIATPIKLDEFTPLTRDEIYER